VNAVGLEIDPLPWSGKGFREGALPPYLGPPWMSDRPVCPAALTGRLLPRLKGPALYGCRKRTPAPAGVSASINMTPAYSSVGLMRKR